MYTGHKLIALQRMLEPHNERRWLDAELMAILTDDGNAWMLKYEDGDESRVVFTRDDQLQQ